MWKRKELKAKAKEVLKRDYWKLVLVSLILMLISGGLGSGSSYKTNSEDFQPKPSYSSESNDHISISPQSFVQDVKEGRPETIAIISAIVIGVLVVVLIISAISIVVSVFVFNPLIVGIRRFFSREMKESVKIKEIAFAFDNSYKNIIKIMFFKDLYTFLWSLLLIIPGIIKAY